MASPPDWWGEVAICEQFGWDEETMKTKNSLGFIRKVSAYNNVKNKVEREEEQKREQEARRNKFR